MEYTKHSVYISKSVHFTAKEYFILLKTSLKLSLPGFSFFLYNDLLTIKEAKLKDVRDLAFKYVPSNNRWYYNDLK